MKKKILCIGILAILIAMLFILTGCGSKSTEETTKDDNSQTLASVVKVGDYVSYNAGEENTYTSPKEKNGNLDMTFKTTGDEKWRVLSIEDDGTVNLVSESAITTPSARFVEGTGYANYIDELNNICAIYGNGECATSARSITKTDIIKAIGYNTFASALDITIDDNLTDSEKITLIEEAYNEQKASSLNSNYGKTFTITGENNQRVPSKDNSDGYIIDSNLKITDNYVSKIRMINVSEDKLKQEVGFGKEKATFWLADTVIKAGGTYSVEYCYYGVCCAECSPNSFNNTGIETYYLFSSSTTSKMSNNFVPNGIRPVVTLNKDTKAVSGTGDSNDPFVIK